MINPLRSEREAFRFFVWAAAVAAVLVVVILAVRALV
mgnify:FL=1